MAIDYSWTCTACGATNSAGTGSCGACGSNAITSAAELESRAKGHVGVNDGPPLGTGRKITLAISITAAVAGAIVLRAAWDEISLLTGACLIGVGLIPLGLMAVLTRRK
jgi:predicted ATP-dependent serine protease